MSLTTPLRPYTSTICRQCRTVLLQQRHASSASSTTTSTSPSPQLPLRNGAAQTSSDNASAPPRWARTPEAMRAPHRIRPKLDQDTFTCNSDPAILDSFYTRILGDEGASVLPEDVKWLAITHKSFDQGRRGFNERLTVLGRRIVELQTSLALLEAPRGKSSRYQGQVDVFGRAPFVHPQTESVGNVTLEAKKAITDKRRMAQLAEKYRVGEVLRWHPKMPHDLPASGLDGVLRDTLFAIVGAVALQRGGEVANQVVRTRILRPLGLS